MACISALLLVTRISIRACSSVPAPWNKWWNLNHKWNQKSRTRNSYSLFKVSRFQMSEIIYLKMSLKRNWPFFPSRCTHSLNVSHNLTCSLTVICRSLTSIAFFIILASNSAGVSISPMMSLSKFFDSSDLRSFIRSWGQNNHKC